MKDAPARRFNGGPSGDESIDQFRFCRLSGNGNCYMIGFDRSAFAAKPAILWSRPGQ
jgi:hypothetical protein